MSEENNLLGLLYNFEPNTVSVTEDASDPIENVVTFSIANPGGNPLVQFKNSNKVTVNDGLPGKDEDNKAPNLSRFYLWFPWGSEPQDLAKGEESENITCSPGPNNNTWLVEKMSSGSIGNYWILFPKEDVILKAQESVSFVFSGIKTTAETGMTYMYISYANIPGVDNGYITPEPTLNKIVPPLKVVSFSSDKNVVYKGDEVTLTWRTRSAAYCTISPPLNSETPDKQYPANESKGITFTPQQTGAYILTAYQGTDDVSSKPVSITVVEMKISDFQVRPQRVGVNGLTKLSWDIKNAVKAELDFGDRKVDALLNTFYYDVVPENRAYILTAWDQYNNQLQKQITVIVDKGIVPNQPVKFKAHGLPGIEGCTGGDGQNGQGGRPGCDGQNGSNGGEGMMPVPIEEVRLNAGASVCLTGGNGGPGGNGGNGGNDANGGSGGDGGDGSTGGNIAMVVPPLTTDFDCATVYEIVSRGGDGGKGGRFGKGGGGGGRDGASGKGGNGGNGGAIILGFDQSMKGPSGHYILTNVGGKGGDADTSVDRGRDGRPGEIIVKEVN